jgi:hypothetical protein
MMLLWLSRAAAELLNPYGQKNRWAAPCMSAPTRRASPLETTWWREAEGVRLPESPTSLSYPKPRPVSVGPEASNQEVAHTRPIFPISGAPGHEQEPKTRRRAAIASQPRERDQSLASQLSSWDTPRPSCGKKESYSHPEGILTRTLARSTVQSPKKRPKKAHQKTSQRQEKEHPVLRASQLGDLLLLVPGSCPDFESLRVESRELGVLPWRAFGFWSA